MGKNADTIFGVGAIILPLILLLILIFDGKIRTLRSKIMIREQEESTIGFRHTSMDFSPLDS